VSYNSSASFYLSSNSQYIVDKINALFGHELITRLLLKEIPTAVKPMRPETPEQECRDSEIEVSDDTALEDGELLEKSLLTLKKYL
jgi:hypothetical protein